MAREKVAFISYARKDGEAFASALKKRLEEEQPEITLWMDRDEMAGGVDFVAQLRTAIESVEFLVLVMTPEAIASDWVQKEWRYAREQGVCVCPVKGADDAVLDEARQSLPRWMSRAHTYDIEKEWERFTNFLKSPCQTTRVPFMAPSLPASFVRRPREFDAIVSKVLDERRQNPSGKNVALVGSGGFGKTTLATSLCHDDDVITACDGGILWVTLGEHPSLERELSKLFFALTGEVRTFYDPDDAAIQVFAKLEAKRCLLVIDDVWNVDDVKPFLRPAGETTRLFTTRLVQVAGEVAEKDYSVPIAELTSDESVELLTSRLETAGLRLEPFRRLAARLGEWPLLLELANATMREQVQFDETVEGALKWVNQSLDEASVTAFDRADAAARNNAIAKTLEVSLAGLGDMRERCVELSVFAEDAEVPLALAAIIWKQNELQTRRIAQRLGNLSLIKLNLGKNTFRMHDATRAYLATRLKQPVPIHGLLADAWSSPALASTDYAARFAVFHLVEAMAEAAQASSRCRQLVDLLSNPAFLDNQQKHRSGINRDLVVALQRASCITGAETPPLVAALAIAMRAYDVSRSPARLFELVRQGELRLATEGLDLFDVDHEWRAAALLTIAWIAAETQPEQAADLCAKAKKLSTSAPLPALAAWVEQAPAAPAGLKEPSGGPGLDTIASILERAGGTGMQTGIEPLLIEGIFQPVAPGERAQYGKFIALQDGPPLVDFARLNPGMNTAYLRKYIAIHAANRYRYYRNRSLWMLLPPILRVPDTQWVRQLAEELVVSALTITNIDFQDGVPLTVLGLQAHMGDATAATALDNYRNELQARAAELAPGRGKSDSWALYQRRAAALGEVTQLALGQSQQAAELLALARGLPKGFAGFRAAASLTLAESFRLVTPADVAAIEACVTSALAAAHRIQDDPFCFQMTSFVRTMQRHWPPARPFDVDDVIGRFADDPQHPDFCPVCVVGEQYEFRPVDMHTLPLPELVRNASTLSAIAEICECSRDGIAEINQSLPADEELPPGTDVRYKDPEFVPLLAARLAAEALASPIDAAQRSALIQRLVPLAASNRTALETVLSRLLLSVSPGPVHIPRPLAALTLRPWDDGITPTEAVVA